MNYWLIKSEMECYGIDDLKKDKKTFWSGVRNYQARNFMMKGMEVGDGVLFYHSNGTKENPAGVYGLAKVASKARADETQFDKTDEHYDKKATKEKPIWYSVDMAFVKKFKEPVSLSEIKIDPAFAGMPLLAPGQRLSVMPVSKNHFEYIVTLAEQNRIK
jgi:predicted RNA-binding protein with PUA-like domain